MVLDEWLLFFSSRGNHAYIRSLWPTPQTPNEHVQKERCDRSDLGAVVSLQLPPPRPSKKTRNGDVRVTLACRNQVAGARDPDSVLVQLLCDVINVLQSTPLSWT